MSDRSIKPASPARAGHGRPRLLVVDDDSQIVYVIRQFGERAGFEVTSCTAGREALARVASEHVDLAVLDLRMPDVGGLEVLRAVRDADPDCQTVLMSGEATIDSAVEAVKLGAVDYLTKPFDFDRLKAILATVKDDVSRRRQLLVAEREIARSVEFCGMIGRSPVMQELFGLVKRLAPHIRTALVTGETGVGKELVARALHDVGPRRPRRFVAVNCSAIPDTLVESELFGHARGAFTGAAAAKAGIFEAADGGTVFLDEIGELPLAAQAKLLRVLETGEIQRVGEVDTRRLDVRIVAATNRELEQEVAEGRFRSDLFYRLNVVEIHIAPLRDRREDIPYLTAAFVREFAARMTKRLVGTTKPAERWLLEQPWPGNVRELRNVVERACLLAEGEFVTERELTGGRKRRVATTSAPVDTPPRGRSTDELDAYAPLSTLERHRILEVMEQTGGNKVAAARILGLSRRSLYRRLERYVVGASSGALDS